VVGVPAMVPMPRAAAEAAPQEMMATEAAPQEMMAAEAAPQEMMAAAEAQQEMMAAAEAQQENMAAAPQEMMAAAEAPQEMMAAAAPPENMAATEAPQEMMAAAAQHGMMAAAPQENMAAVAPEEMMAAATAAAATTEAGTPSVPAAKMMMTDVRFAAPLVLRPHCGKCQRLVDPIKPGTRLVSKVKQEYNCPTCNSKCVVMHRALGQWPTPEFSDLPKEAQLEFYTSDGCGKDFKKKYTDLLCKHHAEGRETYAQGDFQPLSYWEKQGYDVARIEANTPPEDIRENSQLGTCYRVKIEGSKDFVKDFLERSQLMQKLATKRKMKEITAGHGGPSSAYGFGQGLVPPGASSFGQGLEQDMVAHSASSLGDGEGDEQDPSQTTMSQPSDTSSSSSSSSSSSASNRKKKTKKAKKKAKKCKKKEKKEKKKEKAKKEKERLRAAEAKKKEKEAAKQAKEQAKEAAKEEKRRQEAALAESKLLKKEQVKSMTVAVKSIAKMQPIVMDLNKLLFNPTTRQERSELQQVPRTIVAEAMSNYKRAVGIYNECQSRMADASVVLLFDLGTVVEVAHGVMLVGMVMIVAVVALIVVMIVVAVVAMLVVAVVVLVMLLVVVMTVVAVVVLTSVVATAMLVKW